MDALRRFWQTLSVDVPWAISNWLWTQILTPMLASLRQLPKQLTLRRMVYVAAFFAVAYAAAPLLPADLVLIFAGDTALYIEIASFAYLAIARGRVHRVLVPTMQMLRVALRRAVTRVAARAKRPMRKPRLFDKDDTGDVPDGAFLFA